MKDRLLNLYLLRPGFDKGNAVGKFIDAELTVEGIAQITKFADNNFCNDFNRIYTSPSLEAIQTGEIIANKWNKALIKKFEMRPRNLGVATGMSYREVTNRFSELLENSFSKDFMFPKGESNIQVYDRVKKFIESIINSITGIRESILLISSPLVLNYVIYVLHNIGFKEGMLYIFDYGQYAFFESHGQYFQLKKFSI